MKSRKKEKIFTFGVLDTFQGRLQSLQHGLVCACVLVCVCVCGGRVPIPDHTPFKSPHMWERLRGRVIMRKRMEGINKQVMKTKQNEPLSRRASEMLTVAGSFSFGIWSRWMREREREVDGQRKGGNKDREMEIRGGAIRERTRWTI